MPRILAEAVQSKAVTTRLRKPALVHPIEADSPPPPVIVIERRIETVTLSVPLGEIGMGYMPSHVEFWMKPPQAEALQRLVVALRDKRITTAEGREVRTAADAVRWLLEKIGNPC
jgi:hypothetical protein